MSYRVAVVGATGAVGLTMLSILRERNFPAVEVVAFASERSVGERVNYGDRPLTVQALSADSIRNFDIALFSAGSSISEEWAPKFALADAVVIDNSSAWRMDPQVPLVISEVNPQDLDVHRGIVANPNCSTTQMVVALKPIFDAVGIERVVVSTYQSTSGTGKLATEELFTQSRAVLGAEQIEAEVYPHQIAFNVLPQVETFEDGDPYTTEERKMCNETRKILGDGSLKITATCARVPVYNAHSESVNVQTKRPLTADRCRQLLAAAPGIVVVDDPVNAKYPLAIDAAGRDEVFVGRIREDESAENALNMWIVADNLRKGAATNAVQLAELIAERNLLRVS